MIGSIQIDQWCVTGHFKRPAKVEIQSVLSPDRRVADKRQSQMARGTKWVYFWPLQSEDNNRRHIRIMFGNDLID